MDQRPPLRFPAQRKARAPRKLKPATKDCPRCDNLLNRRVITDVGQVNRPPERCKHKGRTFTLNGLLTMVLCICCLNKLRKKATVTVRQVRKDAKNGDGHA